MTGLLAIILSTTELPYSTVTKQGAHSSVIPTHFPPLLMLLFFSPPLSPQLPSFYLNIKVVRLKKNISRLMASSVLRIFTGAFQQFSLKCFPPRYKHSEDALSLNSRIQNLQQCQKFFVNVSFNNLRYMLFIVHHFLCFTLVFPLLMILLQCKNSRMCPSWDNIFSSALPFSVSPTGPKRWQVETCWQTSFRFKHLAVSLCCSAKSWCSHLFLQCLEESTVSMVSFEPTLPPVVCSSSKTQWWCPWLLCRLLFLWPEASWKGFGSH